MRSPWRLRLRSLSFVLLLTACGDEQVLTTTRHLDRPGPLTMACAGRVEGSDLITGYPLSGCGPEGNEDVAGATLFGFVANTSRGEVAVFRTTSSGERLVDLDKGSPGYGFLPVGTLPADLKTTTDGCRVVSANAGSCDLSVIDVPGVLAVASGELKTPSGAVVSRVVPHTASGPLRAAPQEMILLGAGPAKKPEDACPSGEGYRALVTFPRCNLVAELDLTTGRVLQGLLLGPQGFRMTPDPVCPVECLMRGESIRVDAGQRDTGVPDAPAPDRSLRDAPVDHPLADRPADLPPLDAPAVPEAGQPADGGILAEASAPAPDLPGQTPDSEPPPSPPDAGPPADAMAGEGIPNPTGDLLPHGLAFDEGRGQLYVSLAGAGFIVAIDVNRTTGVMERPRRIPLWGGVRTTRIKLSPEGQRLGRYLYTIASDRSVRVISTSLERECETNLDLSQVATVKGEVPLVAAGCFPVGDPGNPPRRVTAEGNGFTFGSRIPLDLTFVTARPGESDGGTAADAGAATPLQGIFALVATSDGQVYVVDVEDWTVISPTSQAVPLLHLPHRFRNGLQGSIQGVPDASISQIRGAGDGGVPVVVSEEGENGGWRKLEGEGVFLRAVGESVTSEWSLVYEDRLLGRWSGQLVQSSIESGQLTFTDPGAGFCSAGVEGQVLEGGRAVRHGDILSLVGCKEDSECGLDQICVKPVAQPTEFGLCFAASRKDELYKQCFDFLKSRREYLVTQSTEDRLVIDILPVESRRVIRQSPPPPTACASNADCAEGFLCALADQSIPGTPDRSLKQGECFRPGCERNEDCPSGYCLRPLDGSAAVCAAVPPPLDPLPWGKHVSCKSDGDCRPQSVGGFCTDDQSCGDPLAECRSASTESTDRQCFDKGMVCGGFPGRRGTCLRPSPCFSELLRYDVLAGRSFLVGSYRRNIPDPETEVCRANEDRSPLFANRLYVGLPTHPVLLGPECRQEAQPLEPPQPNPCFERRDRGYRGFNEKVTGGLPYFIEGQGPATVVHFANPDIWFSLGLSHLSQPAVSSSAGPLDGGTPPAAALPVMPQRGLTIQLDVGGGFSRLRAATSSVVSLPVWLVEGPDGYVYLVDMGDRFGSGGSRGQVIRLSHSTIEVDSFSVK